MSALESVPVRDDRGVVGSLETAEQPDGNGEVVVRLSSGERVRLPAEALIRQTEGGYHVRGTFSDFESVSAPREERRETIPVAEERLNVRKEVRETGRVRISKHVREHVETIDEPLLAEDVEVRRVPVDRPIEAPVEIRQEGETTIIPVVEEQLVLKKQLVLKEELHVTRRRTERREPQEVALRREEVEVERFDVDPQRHAAKE